MRFQHIMPWGLKNLIWTKYIDNKAYNAVMPEGEKIWGGQW